MRKIALLWDVISFAILITVVVLKITGVFTFGWLWVIIPTLVIIAAEFVISVVIRKKITGRI